MEALDERPVWSMSGSEKLAGLDGLDAEFARLQTRWLDLVGSVDETGYAEELGARDVIQLLTMRYRLDRAQVSRDVRLARALPKYAAVARGLADGTELPPPDPDSAADVAAGDDVGVRLMRPEQAWVVVSELERVRSRVPVELLDVAEAELVKLAGRLPLAELRKSAREICEMLDVDGPEPDENKAYERESLTLINAPQGVKFRGYLANENAEALKSAVFTGARPHKTANGDLDPRPREKRQADALSAALAIAAAALDAGLPRPPAPVTPTSHAEPPTAPDIDAAAAAAGADGAPEAAGADVNAQAGGDFTGVDLNAEALGDVALPDLEESVVPAGSPSGARPAGSVVGAGGRGAGWVPGFGAKANITITIDFEDLKAATANATGGLVYGDRLSAATIRRLACDAKIIPLLLGSKSEPLDVGRAERLITRGMRRALNHRDKGCVVCGAPPVMCDAHHLTSWIDGGVTAVRNLVLLCRRHHSDLHLGHWQITIVDGEVRVSQPGWANPPPHRKPAQTRPPGSTGGVDRPRANHPEAAATSPRPATQAGRWSADAFQLSEAASFAVWDHRHHQTPGPILR